MFLQKIIKITIILLFIACNVHAANLHFEQWQFVCDVATLIFYVKSLDDYSLSFGEAYRTKEQQKIYKEKGLSKTLRSKHLKRLAVDLNVFYCGMYIGSFDKKTQYELIEPIGIFWKKLNKKNVWGGDWIFRDVNHFERKV